ncbi:MAG: hypothetical protein IKJ77_00330 [Firmicutes bacterium]|nr:hypothetical protein [Bacillota bacterium]
MLMNGYIVAGVIAAVICIVCLGKQVRKMCFERKMDKRYEALGAEERGQVFGGDKQKLYFIGELLKQEFPQGNPDALFEKYVALYQAYIHSGYDVYQTVQDGSAQFADFDENEVYTMTAIVVFSDECGGRYNRDSAEEVAACAKRVKNRVKRIGDIAACPEALGMNTGKRLGEKDHAILVAGEKGIETYLNSLVAEDGTRLERVHKGTLYVKDENMDTACDLRKYSLRDAESGIEICHLWFNTYGITNCETCIDGFVFEKDVLEGKIRLADPALSAGRSRLEPPADIKAGNAPSTGKPKITWTEAKGADKYFIYRSRKADSGFVYRGSSSTAEYIDANAETGTSYYYKVVAADTGNQHANSEPSDVCGTVCVLPAPVVTAGSEEGTGRVKLTWEPVEGALRYVIYRATSEDGEYKRMYRQKMTTYVNVAFIEPHVQYFYKIRAVHANDAANSPFSTVVTGSWEPPVEESPME